MATLNAHKFHDRGSAEAHFLAAVDEWALEQRRTNPAQEVMYSRKLAEAAAGGGDLLSAEAIAVGASVPALCERVIAQARARDARWACIEASRTRAKRQIREATNAAEMHAVHRELLSDKGST